MKKLEKCPHCRHDLSKKIGVTEKVDSIYERTEGSGYEGLGDSIETYYETSEILSYFCPKCLKTIK